MTESPLTPDVTPSELNDDLSCTSCGYNLRGLRTEGNCPECATPISRSVHGNLLRYADPEWVDKLRLGSALMLWSIVVAGGPSFSAGLLAGSSVPRAFTGLITFAGGLVGVWAVFLLTTLEPTVAFLEDSITLRRVVRVCAVFQWFGSALQTSSAVAFGPIVGVVGGLMLLVGVVSYFGMFVFLRRFAMRVPDEKLAASTRTVMWGFGISMVLIAATGIITTVAAGASTTSIGVGSPGPVAAGWTSGAGLAVWLGFICVAAIAGLVFGLWFVVLLFRYRRMFKQAAIESRATLAAAIAGSDNHPSDVGPQN